MKTVSLPAWAPMHLTILESLSFQEEANTLALICEALHTATPVVLRELDYLYELGMVSKNQADMVARYYITAAGRQTLALAYNQLAASQPAAPANNAETNTAVLCIDEDELNNWWESLDVEQKADAFAGFSLTIYQRSSHIYVDTAQRVLDVPVLGTIGGDGENANLSKPAHTQPIVTTPFMSESMEEFLQRVAPDIAKAAAKAKKEAVQL